MARLTAEQIVDKQIKRTQQATGDYTAGVNSVSDSPTAAAASKVEKYRAGIERAIETGAYVEGLMAVSLSDWKTATAGKASRWSEGVSQARPKLMKFQREYGPIRESVQAQVKSMPNDTFEERMARMTTNARGLHDQPYKGRGRRR